MNHPERMLLSGNEAVALAAYQAGVALGVGYPGTPSTEILENFARLGGHAQWSPNEKVALEVGLGASFGGAATLVTMKHVGVNVAADPLFTAAYIGASGPLVLVSADDPGMASSQNEQDNRRFAVAAAIPMLEPGDSQEAYDYTLAGLRLSAEYKLPVMLRMTTRVCHSKTVVRPTPPTEKPAAPHYVKDIPGRVMIPAYARPAHRRLRDKLTKLEKSQFARDLLTTYGPQDAKLCIITSGISAVHCREAAPEARILKIGLTHPLPMEAIEEFIDANDFTDLRVIEEGDPYLEELLRANYIAVEGKPEMYRFGEFNVGRVRRILDKDRSPEPPPTPGKPPELCKGCPHRTVFQTLRDRGCIVAGDIGCYTLGVLSPFEAIDTCVCMGASIGVGLGLRHVLPEDQARKVVSVIGDSTFVHSGLTGIAEMVYNPPPTGHLLLILDNGTTAMTGQQEHPGTGRTLDHQPTGKIVFEKVLEAMGVEQVHVVDPWGDTEKFEQLVDSCLASGKLSVIIARRPCILAVGKIKEYERLAQATACTTCGDGGEG
ncbi:MAG TPA: thiamine pyrophosphate-binding protein [Verrucomicrobia bacterium]|nr:thiamine pyrophosphate-binding protein [Verrucomicrobiota bacterium]